MGSLFDGIGGFPYAATFYGITPLWASEVLPCAISVTRRWLPEMAHVGDITKLDGGKLPPVDIVTFGSPCQGLSYAGRRRGLADERSGLFSEAIRVILEMRRKTGGRYPRYALWENVPGALSSSGGRDFHAVLQAFLQSEIPVPRSGRWANAGLVRGRGSQLAWIVYNAQYFGTAQRRRRIFLVLDFGGESAGEILFVPKSLRGYFAAGGTPRQGAAGYAPAGAGSPQGHGQPNCLTPWDVQSRRIHSADGTWPALYGGEGGGRGYVMGGQPVVCLNDQGGSRLDVEQGCQAPTLRSETHGNLPVICIASGQPGAEIMADRCPTLTCYHEQPILCSAVAIHQNQDDNVTVSETAYSAANASDLNAPLVMESWAIAATSIGRLPHHGGNGLGIGREVSPTLTATDRHAVAAIDCRNFRETRELSGTLQAKESGGYSLNSQNPIRTGTVLRRLTPVECERLQGYPDGWTAAGHDGVEISDTKRYQMLGNSIAVPCAAYILLGMAEHLRKE